MQYIEQFFTISVWYQRT